MRLSGKASKLVIASNRGPIEYRLDQGKKLKKYYGTGGLITALKYVPEQISKNAIWVALTMTQGDRTMLKQIKFPSRLFGTHGIRLHYVNIPKKSHHKYYNLICNQILWFFHHNLHNLIMEDLSIMRRIPDSWMNGYRLANQAVADAVSQDIDSYSNCVVMLHDYHLFLAPAMIRKLHPTSVITQFIHVPWPHARCWQLLPSNIIYDIFKSLISGNNIIGFQTAFDARNFLEGAHSFLKDCVVDFENRVITSRSHDTYIRIYPISISIVEERQAIRSATRGNGYTVATCR
jgi:trehalose 6-phosphate synthase